MDGCFGSRGRAAWHQKSTARNSAPLSLGGSQSRTITLSGLQGSLSTYQRIWYCTLGLHRSRHLEAPWFNLQNPILQRQAKVDPAGVVEVITRSLDASMSQCNPRISGNTLSFIYIYTLYHLASYFISANRRTNTKPTSERTNRTVTVLTDGSECPQ